MTNGKSDGIDQRVKEGLSENRERLRSKTLNKQSLFWNTKLNTARLLPLYTFECFVTLLKKRWLFPL